jgi:hypothetical protein
MAVQVDKELSRRGDGLIVGAARHVDDFYIGVRIESDALAVLSHLRESLYEYELHINDLKTAVLTGVEPLDDPWAPRLRLQSNELAHNKAEERIVGFFDEAVSISRSIGTQSPVKLAVRRADRYDLYRSPYFEYIESRLQRMTYHFPHAIDYICLFVAERLAVGEAIDRPGWSEVVNSGIQRHLVLGHHHEACWLFWFSVICGLSLPAQLAEQIPKQNNLHLIALLIQAFIDGKCTKPRIRFGNKISSDDRRWLINLVSRCVGFTRARFSGCYTDECEHLAARELRLINFEAHLKRVSAENVRAISNARFGYEDDERDEFDDVLDEIAL